MDNSEVLTQLQKDYFEKGTWSPEDLLPYYKRRDRTFGQFVANKELIELEPFVHTLAGESAISVCDGRAVEASYLKSNGLIVTATDLYPEYLHKAFEGGAIDNFSEEDAENLSYKAEEFDWGIVKAGLHHLPRPIMGIYELLRVSRKGIFILEGHDGYFLRVLRKYLFPGRDWEPSGNYVYRFRERELAKLCLSLNIPAYAVKTSFLAWNRKHESICKGELGYRVRIIFYRFLNCIFASQGNNFTAVIFKIVPQEHQIKLLKKYGFRYVKLSPNPAFKGFKDGAV